MSETSFKTGFPDLPIDPSRSGIDNQDLLGLDTHAEALASFINMCSTPMTIGVQGDWGSGKTSLMNLVRAKLGDVRVLNIWFNTWQYSQFGNEDRLASSMLVNLMHKVKSEGKPSKKVWHNASRFVRAVVQAASSSSGVDARPLFDALEGKVDFDDAGLFEQMKEDFAEVIRDILSEGGEYAKFERVVIYIDDLDRLAPAKAVELLEAVKNLIDVEGCVFVLAIDYDVVIRGLRQKKGYDYNEGREDEGKNFFDKIIQVPYRMPVERYSTQHFLKNHYVRVYGELSAPADSFFEDRSAGLIRLSVGNNPRGLKRALNIHSLFSHLISVGEQGDVGENGRIMTLVLAFMQVAMPGMYSVLAKQASPFRTLVALCEPKVYELLALDDEDGGQFELVAEHLDQVLQPLQEGGEEDDDDDGNEQLVAELRALIGDLRRVVTDKETGKQRRMQGLAKIALQAIDVDGNGTYAQRELAVLDAALSVAKSTSVETAEVEVEDESAAIQTRRHVGFRELAQSMSVFASQPNVMFYDPLAEQYDENVIRQPDYETDVARLQLIVDGAPVRIKDETLRILERRAERGERDLSAREEAGRIRATDYWVVKGDAQERTLTMLREEWKIGIHAEVDVRSQTGRDAFDARVLAYLRSHGEDYVPASDVAEHVGGTKIQVRASLNRLIEQELVTWIGKARGTRYRAL